MGSTYSSAKIDKNKGISKCLHESKRQRSKEKYSTNSESDNNLSISLKDSEINTVPLSVLERMFEKAKSLVRNDGLVLEKPGATDGSYIAAGSANLIFCVSPGKGGSFKCDRSCINSRTKTCEHVIAVTEKSGKLQQIVEWFRRSKCGASVTALALNGAPKSMGRKGNGRKRSNKKRANIEEVVNIFDENEIENPSL